MSPDVPLVTGALRELLAGDDPQRQATAEQHARAWVADMTDLDGTAAALQRLLDLMAQRKALVAV
jgi:hypothetical protein